MAVCAKSKQKFRMFSFVRLSKDFIDSVSGILCQGMPGIVVEFFSVGTEWPGFPTAKENHYMVEFSHYPKEGESVVTIPESCLEYIYKDKYHG